MKLGDILKEIKIIPYRFKVIHGVPNEPDRGGNIEINNIGTFRFYKNSIADTILGNSCYVVVVGNRWSDETIQQMKDLLLSKQIKFRQDDEDPHLFLIPIEYFDFSEIIK